MIRAGLLLCAVLLAGCAGNRYCMDEQPYQRAESIPPIEPTDGLRLPESAAALKVPPPPENAVAFGTLVSDASGRERRECLDQPPPMPEPKSPPAELTPAAPAPG